MTRKEIEQKLATRYLGKVVIFTQVNSKEVCGKIDRITAEVASGEPMAIFVINHMRYECDVTYFTENTIICNRESLPPGGTLPP